MEIPPTMALIAMLTKKATRGGAMGFYTTMRMLGLALGPLFGGFLHDQDALSNFLVGALILVYRPFDTGDHISVSGGQGEVVEVNLRYTGYSE